MDLLHSTLESLLALLKVVHPLWFALAIAFLPLLGVPASPLIILAGVRFGPVWGSLMACVALMVNIAAGYWVSACSFGPSVQRWLAGRSAALSSVSRENETRFILLCRITPGVPLVVQNYVLGSARVSFSRYLMISLPIQWTYAAAFVVFGDSLAHSNLWRIMMAVALLIAVVIGVGWIRRISAARVAPQADVLTSDL